METNELRLNNWILDLFGGWCQVRGLTKNGVWIRDEGGPAPISAFKPIKIHKGYLWVLGFKPIGNDFVKDGFFIHSRKRGLNVRKGISIDYLHQLQNVYYIFKGEELWKL